jgi:ABC-type nitrate/sulfonate/bicarbonate transport system permease component
MNAENARTAYLFATTLMSALLGLVIFAGVSLAGNLILRRGHYQQGQ